LGVLNKWQKALKSTILHYLKIINPSKIRLYQNIDSTGRQEVVGSPDNFGTIFSTSNTKPYSNVRLFLWGLGGDIGLLFDGKSVKWSFNYRVLNWCMFSSVTTSIIPIFFLMEYNKESYV
jgi:hypothetical protein